MRTEQNRTNQNRAEQSRIEKEENITWKNRTATATNKNNHGREVNNKSEDFQHR